MATIIAPARARRLRTAQSTTTGADLVRSYASRQRVFSYGEMALAIGAEAAKAITRLVNVGEIASPAAGIFHLPEIRSEDDRVVRKIKELEAKPTRPDVLARRALKAEEASAKALLAVASKEPIVDQVRRFAAKYPVFSREEVRKECGKGAPGAIDALVKKGEIVRIQDGLYSTPGVEPMGPEMKAYIAAHGAAAATLRRHMEEAERYFERAEGEGDVGITYRIFPSPEKRREMTRPMKTRIYVNVARRRPIYAESRGKGVPGLVWRCKDGTIPAIVAETIARSIFREMPESIREFLQIIEDGEAPKKVRLRSGTIRPESDFDPQPGEATTAHAREEPVDRGEAEERSPPRQDYDPGPTFQTYYGRNETRGLDPRKMKDKLKEKVYLQIDKREPDWLFTLLADIENLEVHPGTLDIGDMVATCGDRRLIFERKASTDLVASLTEEKGQRYKRQIKAMSNSGITSCVIVEGGMFGAKAPSINMLARTRTRLVFGRNIHLIETVDIRDTAYAVVCAIYDYMFGQEEVFEMEPVKMADATPSETAVMLLRTIPGVSKVRAEALIDRFGSVASVARAGIAKIRTVNGIGPETAQSIYECLNEGEKRKR